MFHFVMPNQQGNTYLNVISDGLGPWRWKLFLQGINFCQQRKTFAYPRNRLLGPWC